MAGACGWGGVRWWQKSHIRFPSWSRDWGRCWNLKQVPLLPHTERSGKTRNTWETVSWWDSHLTNWKKEKDTWDVEKLKRTCRYLYQTNMVRSDTLHEHALRYGYIKLCLWYIWRRKDMVKIWLRKIMFKILQRKELLSEVINVTPGQAPESN